jgi:hypothetical protein
MTFITLHVQGAQQVLSALFQLFYCRKIICAHIQEEVGGRVEPINGVSVLVGADAEKIEDRTMAC